MVGSYRPKLTESFLHEIPRAISNRVLQGAEGCKAEFLVERPGLKLEGIEKDASEAVFPGKLFDLLYELATEPLTWFFNPKMSHMEPIPLEVSLYSADKLTVFERKKNRRTGTLWEAR